mmetsp:Transcript_2264/g.7545  ORF Transcript_2264/g.7545 Transcript_2264/m.7545 type:complete len:350 (-) Transcript_2264:316-1365(-)
MSGGWCTIESDPGVFTELIESFGCKGVQVEEVWDMSDEGIAALGEVFGCIFLFKWVDREDTRETVDAPEEQGIFFAKQVIQNACATQAIISVLMNCQSPHLSLGPSLSEFREFTGAFPADLKGAALSDSHAIRTAHNSFARPEPFQLESKKATEDDDVYHFIAYVPINGAAYELDGLKPGPVFLGAVDDAAPSGWFATVRPAIQERFEAYSKERITFTLLALVRNRKDAAMEAAAAAESELASVEAEVAAAAGGGDGVAALEARRGELQATIAAARRTVEAEEEKFRAWKAENVRRKHNWVPLIAELLKVCAEAGKLPAMRESARTKLREAIERAKKEGVDIADESADV